MKRRNVGVAVSGSFWAVLSAWLAGWYLATGDPWGGVGCCCVFYVSAWVAVAGVTVRLFRGRLQVYIDTRDVWVGVYVADDYIYVLPLVPTVVVRWERRHSWRCVGEWKRYP